MNLPKVQFLKGKEVELLENYVVELPYITFEVRAGYKTDGASIPRIFWWFSNPFSSDTLPAAIVHDALYQTEFFPRSQADSIFYNIMKLNKVNLFKRTLYYLAVRLFGWIVWLNHNRIRKNWIKINL